MHYPGAESHQQSRRMTRIIHSECVASKNPSLPALQISLDGLRPTSEATALYCYNAPTEPCPIENSNDANTVTGTYCLIPTAPPRPKPLVVVGDPKAHRVVHTP